MTHLDDDAAMLRAADIHYGPVLKGDDGDELVTISLRALQRIANARFNKVSNRPGKAGYSDNLKSQVRADYFAGKQNIHRLAKTYGLCDATVKRWVSPSKE